MTAILAAVIGPLLTAVLGVGLYIVKKVHDHDLADQALANEVGRMHDRLDEMEMTMLDLKEGQERLIEHLLGEKAA